MRLTQICLRQHIGRMFKRHWVIQGKRVPIEMPIDVTKFGIVPQDALEYVSGKKQIIETPKVDLSGVPNAPRKSNLNCQTEFLIEGLEHAGHLTKTAIIDHLPEQMEKAMENVIVPDAVHEGVRTTILRDQLFEYRPFKTDHKPMVLTRLIDSCDQLIGGTAALEMKTTRNSYFSLPVQKEHRTLSFETTLDHVVWRKPSSSEKYNLAGPEDLATPVLSIAPIAFDASLFKNTEDIQLNYPVLLGKMPLHPHLIVQQSTDADLKTFHETEATESQFMSRALMSAFVAAASTAVSCYGANVKQLPKPIVIRSVLNHGHRFYFGCYQLNTLDLNGTGEDVPKSAKNYWFHSPVVETLYWKAPPKVINPVFPHHRQLGETVELFKLRGYNERVLRTMFALYSHFPGGSSSSSGGKQGN